MDRRRKQSTEEKGYNFYKVEASLAYGIGKLLVDGSNIQQNKPYVLGKVVI